ncbi:MAG: hypothetical protein WAK93_14790 [Solirubrobacteraceae bacterium]
MALSQGEIAEPARRLLADGYELMLASNREVLDQLNLDPFGVPITPVDFLAAGEHPWEVGDLMRVYNVLNEASFGEKGIPLQNWVMLDLGLLPSAFLLLTLSAERAAAARSRASESPRSRSVLAAVLDAADRLGYRGPIPVAGYCAAPTPVPGAWVGWSLCSAIPGLGTIAKALALEAYGARTLTGVAQFGDPALRVHRKFGPMEVLAAVVDLHPVAHTMIYRTQVGQADAEQRPTVMLDPDDLEAQRDLQRKIDAGTSRFYILSPGLVDDRVPILECT